MIILRRFIVIPFIFLSLVATARAGNGVSFEYDEFLDDGKIKYQVLAAAYEYLERQQKQFACWQVKDPQSGEWRQFKVTRVIDTVSRREFIYTVQVEADEIDGEAGQLLFIDFRMLNDGVFSVTRVRIGGRNLKWEDFAVPEGR